MATDLSPDDERYLDQAVQNGDYASKEVALADAVELLKRRDQLRADVRSGIEQADRGELLPAEEVLRRLEERARQIVETARGK